jgi:hypothetical protein
LAVNRRLCRAGYGVRGTPTRAIRLLARTEGLLLDPSTPGGHGAACLTDRPGRFGRHERCCSGTTCGQPALFAHGEARLRWEPAMANGHGTRRRE